LLEGVVTRAVSGNYSVSIAGRTIACTIRGVLKKGFEYSTTTSRARRVTRVSTTTRRDPVSVGDRVRIVPGADGEGVIEEVLPRKSHFTRAGFRGREQTIVSNIELLVIVFACAEPRMDPWKLDHFLVAAESEEIDILVVANKVDLVGDNNDTGFDEFRQLGYTVIDTSVRAGQGMDQLRSRLRDRIAAFVGPSGAGKSSILNALHPEFDRRTGEIGNVTFKGRHTTTASELLALPTGGWVADTPGLRRLELPPLPDRASLLACFPEFRDVPGNCRFDNCRHFREPGCKVRALVDAGLAGRRRYESYLTLAAECDAAPKW
jgi:ribosome biogenesis GTPase / thiamine phosphate phosphatase